MAFGLLFLSSLILRALCTRGFVSGMRQSRAKSSACRGTDKAWAENQRIPRNTQKGQVVQNSALHWACDILSACRCWNFDGFAWLFVCVNTSCYNGRGCFFFCSGSPRRVPISTFRPALSRRAKGLLQELGDSSVARLSSRERIELLEQALRHFSANSGKY